MRLCQWNWYIASVTCKKKSVDDDEILTLPYQSDVLFHIKNPILDLETNDFDTTIGTQTLHIGQVNNALMPYAGYASFTQSEACFQRGQEAKPFTIAMECEVMPYTGGSLIPPLLRKGLAGESSGICCNPNANKPIPWMRVRFKNFATSNIAAFYTNFSGTPIPLNQKHLLVLTYCGNKMLGSACISFFENGVKKTTLVDGAMTESHEFENETSVLTIGGTNGHPNAVARLTMWKRELTETEIALGSGIFDLYESDKIVDAIATSGNGSTLYNALGSNHGTLTNVTLSSVWGTQSDTLSPWNELQGFTLFKNNSDSSYIRVPYKNDGTPNISSLSGYTKISEHPAGAWWNNSEARFKFDDELVGSDMMNSDVDNVFFDVDGTAKWFDLNSVYSQDRGYWYLNILDSKTKRQFTVYKTDKVMSQDVKVLKWHKMSSKIIGTFDHNYHAKLEE